MTTARVIRVGVRSRQALRVWWGSIDSRSGASGAVDSVVAAGSVVSVDIFPPGRPEPDVWLGVGRRVVRRPTLAPPEARLTTRASRFDGIGHVLQCRVDVGLTLHGGV